MIYTIAFIKDGRVSEVVCNFESLHVVVDLLEKENLRFKVTNSSGQLSQEHFGCGGYNHWLSHDERFHDNTPEEQVKQIDYDKCVHTEHCCDIHGCKYGDVDCPVYLGMKPQSFVCETCYEEGVGSVKDKEVVSQEAFVKRTIRANIRMIT